MVESQVGAGGPGSDGSVEPPLDFAHLSRMTMGDRDLEREVLQLFGRQAGMLAERLSGASTTVAASCAHTLKGSARGIGAWPLARAAERVEQVVAAGEGGEDGFAVALAQLAGAVDETRNAIARHLQTSERPAPPGLAHAG